MIAAQIEEKMNNNASRTIKALSDKGVRIPNPDSIEIGAEVDIGRISGKGVTLHTGCKVFGSSTLILAGSTLGREGPVTVENCQIGTQVELRAGSFIKAVFLSGASVGFGCRIREGTILEERASAAHTVDLKHTILFPFVTLGSLINFCDCLMAGGTSRQEHSEVGSSFIHFNYTPNQDKATPSLIGDVARGVMLNQRSIFLGGQGGLVGPCRLEFGTITAAGSICRKDQLRPNRLVYERGGEGGNIPYYPDMYRSVKRIVVNNLIYIANLMALIQWYLHVRQQFVSDEFPETLLSGVKEKLQMAVAERVNRLEAFSQKMPESVKIYQETLKEGASSLLIRQKQEIHDNFSDLKEMLGKIQSYSGDEKLRDMFLKHVTSGIRLSGKDYITVIKGLDSQESETGTRWLQGIVDHISDSAMRILPSLGAAQKDL